jgi:HAD superfamily phosphoserine phosphatase-like hydrolase
MKFAFFDLDGTLVKGFCSMEFMKYATDNGLYSRRIISEQERASDDFLTGKISYHEWCEKWGNLWAKGFAGQRRTDVQRAMGTFFEGYKINIFDGAKDLVNAWKEREYTPVIVSTADHDLASKFARELGIKHYYGTQIHTETCVLKDYLDTNLHMPNGKEELVKRISEGAESTAGFGDSVGDEGFLRLVQYPHAINPAPGLEEIAKAEGWPIIRLE